MNMEVSLTLSRCDTYLHLLAPTGTCLLAPAYTHWHLLARTLAGLAHTNDSSAIIQPVEAIKEVPQALCPHPRRNQPKSACH